MPTKTTANTTTKTATRKPVTAKSDVAIEKKKPKPSAPATIVHTDAKAQRKDLDLDYYRTLLFGERGRLETELEQLRNRNTDMENALPEDGEGGDEDTADLAAAMMDKEMDLSVEEEIEDMLAQVAHALEKMEAGTYGICDMSGEPIPASRLEYIPWASLTVECQALSEGE